MISRAVSGALPFSRARGLAAFALLCLSATGLVALLGTSAAAPALAAESECPNQALRAESNSTQLPDCRAYELVSPPDTDGIPSVSGDSANTESPQNGAEWDQVTPAGAIFWISRAQPAGTGALPNGSSVGVFVSRRAAGGWSTRDLTPFSTIGNNELIAGAPDGSTALIRTQTSLLSEDQDNPFNNQGGTPSNFDVYRVSEAEAPLLVSHGTLPRTVPPETDEGLRGSVVFNVQLTAAAFVSSARLTEEASTGFSDCYAWSDVRARLASLTNPEWESTEKRNCELLGIMPDGRPIFKDRSGDSYNGLIFVGNGPRFPIANITPVQLSAPISTATTFDALSTDGTLAYVTTAYPLGNEERGSEPDVYAVTVPAFPHSSFNTPGQAGAENTVICLSCQLGGGGAATFMGQSADGSHVFFNVAESAGESASHPYKGLWSWDRNSKTAARLTAATDVEQLVFSQNGQYAAGLTRQLAANPNGTADVYEFSTSLAEPRLITSGTSADTYLISGFVSQFKPPTNGGVSNDGQRVVYDDTPPGSGAVLETLQEWTHGETAQLSPLAATSSYYVLATAGPELEDVFFAAHEPLVGADHNAGTQTIYDARIDGGFPAPTQPVSCSGEACQGTPSTPPAAGSAPGSQGFSGPGNPAPPSPKPKSKNCKKGAARKHGKCVKKRHHTRHVNHKRRTHR